MEFLFEKQHNIQWLHHSLQYVQDRRFPLTNSVARELGMGQRVTAYHFTSYEMAPVLASIQNTRKAVSVMTKVPVNMLTGRWPLKGIHKGGVLYKLTGRLQIASIDDADTTPDQKGRRWIDFMMIEAPGQSQLKIELRRDFTAMLDRNTQFQELQRLVDSDDFESNPNQHQIAMRTVSTYFNISLQFATKYKERLRKLLTFGIEDVIEPSIELDPFGWNELVINHIQLKKVAYLTNPKETPVDARIHNNIPYSSGDNYGKFANRDIPSKLFNAIARTVPNPSENAIQVTYPLSEEDERALTAFVTLK